MINIPPVSSRPNTSDIDREFTVDFPGEDGGVRLETHNSINLGGMPGPEMANFLQNMSRFMANCNHDSFMERCRAMKRSLELRDGLPVEPCSFTKKRMESRARSAIINAIVIGELDDEFETTLNTLCYQTRNNRYVYSEDVTQEILGIDLTSFLIEYAESRADFFDMNELATRSKTGASSDLFETSWVKDDRICSVFYASSSQYGSAVPSVMMRHDKRYTFIKTVHLESGITLYFNPHYSSGTAVSSVWSPSGMHVISIFMAHTMFSAASRMQVDRESGHFISRFLSMVLTVPFMTADFFYFVEKKVKESMGVSTATELIDRIIAK